MRSGEVLAHLPTLLARVDAPGYLPGLIAAKAEAEHGGADGVDAAAVGRDVAALHGVLDAAQEASELPDGAGGYDALHDLVVRARLSER